MPLPIIPIVAALGAGTIGFFIGREMASESEDADCFRYSERGAEQIEHEEEGNPTSADMSEVEALEVLELAAGATPDAIRESHQRLIQRLDPEQGGSSYLADVVNRAKNVLLG